MKKILSFVILFLLVFAFTAQTVNAEEAQQTATTVSVSVTSYFDSDNTSVVHVNDQNYGTTLSMESNLSSDSNYAFAYWIVNGVVRDDLAIDNQFVLTDNLELTGLFYPISPTLKYAVMFMDANGQAIDWTYVAQGDDATAPTSLPTKPGYVVSQTSTWTNSFTNVQDNIVTLLTYDKDTSGTYSLTVLGGTGGGTYDYNTVVTVVADSPPANQYFSHWEVNDRIVSYQSTYSFTMLQDTAITAVYESSAPADLPTVTLSHDLALRTGYKTFLGQFHVPSGYELIEYGVLYSSSSAYLDIDSAGVSRAKAEKYNSNTNEFLVSIDNSKVESTRGYMIVRNTSTSDLLTVYNAPAYSVVNSGFETGSLSGWDSYNIWKDETGMEAFINDRVVDGTYFGGNYSYNRDGSYNIGVEGGSLSWDQSSERMGHLRSSNFTLGGTGWISFKLGGGKNPSFAYVSVRKTTDNTEVARFANRHFNDTTLSGTANAEAYLFQYYFDLSAVATIGESYYFVLSETSSYNWAILSADSFKTHYITAPTTSTDTLAENIVPAILNIGTADNTIKNGYFDSDLSSWQNVDGSWGYDSGHYARSNPNGDGDIGVIRSSAFSIDSNPYIRLDWAGGYSHDKTLFFSIKEVGSNIEVLRYVRRDNLSGTNTNDWNNLMLDLSSLDSSKLYYLEIADNESGSWGISVVDSIRIITQTEWDTVVNSAPGDKAVLVSGLINPYTTDSVYIFNN